MTSPSLELQGAIVSQLKSFEPLTIIIDQRVFDDVPRAPGGDPAVAFPYVSFGPAIELSDDFDCRDGFEISIQIDCWSRAVGFPEVKKISDAVRRALHKFEPALTSNALVYFKHRQTRIFRDPDGKTSHAAMMFEALADQP